MLSTAFIAGSPGVETARVLRRPAEALPPPIPSAAQGAGISGWTQLTAAGALAAAALLRSGKRRSRAPAAVNVMSGPAVFAGAQLDRTVTLGSAGRGQAEATSTGRASRVIAHQVGIGKGKYTIWRRKERWMKYATGFSNRSKTCYRIAKERVMHSLKAKYRSRRAFKRERRKLWIMRVNANTRLHGIKYSKFISKLKEANININRKILSQLGVYDRPIFTNVMQTAIPDWKQLKQEHEDKFKKKLLTIEEIDDQVIPYIEAEFPNLYTDPAMRFNRKDHGWGVEYTVDIGQAEDWQEILPKHPEMANFNIPDHWISNSRMQLEEASLKLLAKVPTEEDSPDYAKFMDKVRAQWADEEEKEKQGIPVPKKEGVSREDWFKEEPQSWF
eukprot:TRINITY_DN10878_c0_g1_i2.p2 TRINITY_DN10878_c0_g1~~TRINITY_DN10878_c0_g1_i2.p2  ORF type:complete len:428 (+),score=113.36 TRINITY_DN10878_c0_g1_i2:126-1286(+)